MNFMQSAPAAEAKVSEPDSKGVSPKPTCSIIGKTKGIAPTPARKKKPPITLVR